MPITSSDIKILASERLNDDSDGGGFMTGTAVQDNVENNLFPDISTLDRALGAIDMRKVYPAVLTPTVDTYYGAHVILAEIPADPAVSVTLVKGANHAETRALRLGALATQDFYGTRPLSANGVAATRAVKVSDIEARVIPTSSVGAATSGVSFPTGNAGGSALIAAGAANSIALASYQYGIDFYDVGVTRMAAIPDSISGNYTDDIGTVALTNVVYQGRPYIKWGASFRDGTVFRNAGFYFRAPGDSEGANSNGAPSAATATTGTYSPAILLSDLPVTTESFDYTNASQPILDYTLVHTSELASEVISYVDSLNRAVELRNDGITAFYVYADGSSTWNASASINRGTKQITGLLDPPPKVGTKVTITYVRSGFTQALGSGALSNSGTISAGAIGVTPSTDYKLAGAFFKANGNYYQIDASGACRNAPIVGSGSIVGYYNFTTQILSVPSLSGAITEWRGIEVSTLFPSPLTTTRTIPANLAPEITISGKKSATGAAWTATANASGEFNTADVTGTYTPSTGTLALTFSAAVASQIDYSGQALTYTPVGEEITGVDPDGYPTSGKLPIFRTGDVVVVHNTVAQAPATVTNSQVVNVGRTNLASIRVIGNNGVEITTGFTVNKAAGTITFNNVAGYSQPVTVQDRVEDIATILSIGSDGTINLNRPLSRTYTSGSSFLSSALIVGDMFARARAGWQQSTWTGVWSDSLIGSAPLADFNEAGYPIVTTNSGAITERWALIFTNTTTFRIVGEQVGEIGVGSVSTQCAPINPGTGQPYFTINASGWGAGWSTGNVYRFNTDGANAPCWVIRSIQPSDPFVGQDHVTLAVRGDINA